MVLILSITELQLPRQTSINPHHSVNREYSAVKHLSDKIKHLSVIFSLNCTITLNSIAMVPITPTKKDPSETWVFCGDD
ncbi:hypothetical protein [Psychrobacter celer]|uniref:hypothetical protein n=1 Tax=Psychrobacter celer TaxID=306572 RepID=UPI003FCFF50D